MHACTGYADRWSAKPGQSIHFMLSSANDAPVTLRFVRHLCADPNPAGPGYSELEMPTPTAGTIAAQQQSAHLGSHAHVPALPADISGGVTLTATIWPTTPKKGLQGLIALNIGAWTLALAISPTGSAMAIAGNTTVTAPRPLLERRWYTLTATLSATGELSITQTPHAPLGDAGTATTQAASAPTGTPEVFLASLSPTSAHYNGKLEAPAITGPNNTPIAAWNFGIGIQTQTATDTGPHAAHAALVNLPTRAMTGSNWTGAVHDWKSAPHLYGAIHFHDDDQGPLNWPATTTLTIPADWPTGLYAAHISNGAGEDYIPFAVRPAAPQSPVALLIPTFSYQVYSSYVRPGRGLEVAARAAAWNSLRETPDMNPEFGLSCYNHHSDGSGVALVTQLRPMLDTRPRQFALMDPVEGGSGTARWVADCYIHQFLTGIDQPHDIITDHDLHTEGLAAIAPYRVVIAGQHPEYHSERMMQALEDHQAQGGRLIYLGGNGFYWRAEPSPDQPDTLEVRRAEGGIRVWETMPGESYHQFGGGYGGLWRRIGRSGHKLTGISFSTQGRHLGFPYKFIDGITNPRVTFMLEGLDTTPGTEFGTTGYMGGGAAGFELDSVNAKYGTPPHALVVAKGIVIHPDYAWVNEDMLVHRHPLPQQDWSCADMTFYETAAGGAVFSVGSMTYAGSLLTDPVTARLTANVVKRFADPAPFGLPEMK